MRPGIAGWLLSGDQLYLPPSPGLIRKSLTGRTLNAELLLQANQRGDHFHAARPHFPTMQSRHQ